MHQLCNYEIKNRIYPILRNAKSLLQIQELTTNQRDDSLEINLNAQQILLIIDCTLQIKNLERHPSDFLEGIEHEVVALKPLIEDIVSGVQEEIAFENRIRARLVEQEKAGWVDLVARNPLEIKLKLSNDLQPVWANTKIIGDVMADTMRFILGQHLQTEIFLGARNNLNKVDIQVGCIGYSCSPLLLEELRKFDDAETTYFANSIEAMILYLCRRKLQVFNGELDLEIQDSHSGELSKTTVILSIPIYDGQVRFSSEESPSVNA